MESSGFTVETFPIPLSDGRTITSDDPEFVVKLPISAAMIDQIRGASDLNGVLVAIISGVISLENSKLPRP